MFSGLCQKLVHSRAPLATIHEQRTRGPSLPKRTGFISQDQGVGMMPATITMSRIKTAVVASGPVMHFYSGKPMHFYFGIDNP
jgi:hypothetical protein